MARLLRPDFLYSWLYRHGRTATYTAHRRDTPKMLWICHPDLKYSIWKLEFFLWKTRKWDNFQTTLLACVLLKKPRKPATAQGKSATPAHLRWHTQRHIWLLQGWTRSSQQRVLHLYGSSLPVGAPQQWQCETPALLVAKIQAANG